MKCAITNGLGLLENQFGCLGLKIRRIAVFSKYLMDDDADFGARRFPQRPI